MTPVPYRNKDDILFMRKFITIAVTGGIGSGKNLVGKTLSRLGCKIFDTDDMVHQLYKTDPNMKRDIISLFGNSVIDQNGDISREKLAEKVFSGAENLKRLTEIVHPRVRKEIFNLFNKLEKENYKGCVVIMVPQLIEAGMQDDFDKVILVVAKEEIRINRCKTRSGLTDFQVKSRMRFQLADEEKIKYADYIVDNNNTVEQTETQTEQIYYKIIETTK